MTAPIISLMALPAAAYWMTLKALEHLYPGALPQRGGIRVEFREDQLSGVTGNVSARGWGLAWR